MFPVIQTLRVAEEKIPLHIHAVPQDPDPRVQDIYTDPVVHIRKVGEQRPDPAPKHR